ncbi:tannase and feruloyl esterase [Dendrothele bispora CBS 962.96]|uniref:Carboxylic ester hydrolase n=1 Tax=Dendrothele bispora (strain CBS 962.96) TaxID=1314807 RepID=A0A4S8MHW2_DENBC|nr:tannase and feruloyl esterase [Dendrothele bispora CBS 962.96]
MLAARLLPLLIVALGFTSVSAQSYNNNLDFNSTCSSISSQIPSIVPNASNVTSQLVLAGTNLTFPNSAPSCNRPSQVVEADICRVVMNVGTSDRSGIRFEAWFPREWSGRFLSTGNGGLGGCIQYEDMAYGSLLGFATVGANNGHDGDTGAPFLNNSEVLKDYAFRSLHTGVVIGKNLTHTFYGSPHNKSYYLGCSTGGREGLKSVQDFPEDFDGIVAGAPAADFNNLIAWMGHFLNVTGNATAERFLPPAQWISLVHPDVLDQCDEIDGVKDGVIEDPNLCKYDPSGLVCSEGKNQTDGGCVTEAQAEMIKQVFEPFFLQGELAFPRMQPGTENLPIFYTGQMFMYPRDWLQFVVHSDPSFDVNTASDQDWILTRDLDPFNISTWSGDLSVFRDREGKLLTYHGQADDVITPINSERYYERVSETMNLDSTDLDEFYRFFRISGMLHCSGGVGAWEIGQNLAGAGGSIDHLNLDPESNVLMAMVRWVEEGVAPNAVLGTKFVNDTVDEGAQFARKHCKYPLRNTYDGVGDPNLKESWSCECVV